LSKPQRSGSDSLNPEDDTNGNKKYSGKRGSLVIALTIFVLSLAAINFAKAYAIKKLIANSD
jgi:hypothetical protein